MSAAGDPVVLVTGAAKRVGRGIALDFASRGWAVGVHFRNSEAAAHELVAQIRAEGGRAAALRADLAREDQVERLVPTATEALGPLRCLINNASTFERDGALDATRASWDLHLESNLRAPFVLIQHFARQLEQGIEGNVINIIDERVWNLTPPFPLVHAQQGRAVDTDQNAGPGARADRSASMRSVRVPPCQASISRRRASVACAPRCPCGAALRPKRSAGRCTSSWRRPP